MAKVTVYSKPKCQQCDFTKRRLDELSVAYEVIDVSENENALKYIKEDLEFTSLPVVVVEGRDPFSGFRPDLLDELARLV